MLINKNLVKFLSGLALICCISIPAITKADNSVVDDSKLTLQVKARLMSEKGIPARNISVETNNGIVILKGKVATVKQADTTVELAESVAGVKDVDASELKVSGSKQPLTDSYITAKVKGLFIKEKLFGDKPIIAMDIKVETKNGIVYLSGEANNEDQAKTAIDLAKQIDGVTEVKSSIKTK